MHAPQVATNTMETCANTTAPIKFLQQHPLVVIPNKATIGSAAYNLYPLEEEIIPPCSQRLVSMGLSCEFLPTIYGQITSRSGLSFKCLIDIITGTLDSNYRGDISILFHNHSDSPYQVSPTQSVAQILFLLLSQLVLMETNQLSKTA